jgi:inner membrane protein
MEMAMETTSTAVQTASASEMVRPTETWIGPATKIALIVAMVLLMLVPLYYVSNLIEERQGRQESVLSDFKRSWGPTQTVLGPILVVPYRSEAQEPRRYLHIAPNQLKVKALLAPEARSRGLFHAIVYSADVSFTGSFLVSGEALSSAAAANLAWDESFVILHASDLRGLKSDAKLSLGGETLLWSDCAGLGDAICASGTVVVAPTKFTGPPPLGVPIPFDSSVTLRGTQSFQVVPVGKDLDLSVASSWSTPSFGGISLPSRSVVEPSGFEASWRTSGNIATGQLIWASTDLLGKWLSFAGVNGSRTWRVTDNQIKIELLEPVPTYRMVERSSKYGVLFLALSFLTYFLFEMISGVRIHLVQYGLLGLSISLFALLLISFSEPLGFTAGYIVSSLMVLLQASLYTATVTRRAHDAARFGGVWGALFGFLYVVLSLETYSLLAGSVALFAVLSVVMVVTRHIDWSPKRPALSPGTSSGADTVSI